MKQRAILYTRVSTDDQNNGYSPTDQRERLLKYCDDREIDIVSIHHDDESAKTFNRPEWIKIMSFIKKHRNAVDVILFVKWDRFSRNVTQSYIAIDELKRYNVEPKAIEQPLDLEIPESKIILAIYLSTPEADNLRRGLTVSQNLRRAQLGGRWLGTLMKGYKRILRDSERAPKDKPLIIPEGGREQEIVVKAFELFATGLYSPNELCRIINREGLKISENAFAEMLQNKGYIGQVYVKAYKDEPAQWVAGQHEPIISKELFYAVQDIIEERARKVPAKYITAREELPLRGYLICPKCGKTLTGSASRGRKGNRFFYYHCSKGCKERKNAEEVNNEFLKVLHAFKAANGVIDLYGDIMQQLFKENDRTINVQLSEVSKEIEKQEQRIKNNRMLMLDGEIKPEEYRENKVDIEAYLERLKAKQSELKLIGNNHEKKLAYSIKLLNNLDTVYTAASVEVKQQLIGSIFPEKLIFENNECRTSRINEVVEKICANNGRLNGYKKMKHAIFDVLHCRVVPPGIEPGTHGFSVRCSTI